MKKIFRKAVASTLIMGSAVFGGMALTGCEGGDAGGSTPTATDDPANPTDPNGPTDPTNPTSDVIVLSRSFNAAAGQIAPKDVSNSYKVSYGDNSQVYGYENTFTNAAFFEPSQLTANKSYTYTGQLDGTGKVTDLLVVRGTLPDGASIKVKNAAMMIFGKTGASSKISIDVPCYTETTSTDGTIYSSKQDPKAPLDKTPILDFVGSGSGSKLDLPKNSKVRINGGVPVFIY